MIGQPSRQIEKDISRAIWSNWSRPFGRQSLLVWGEKRDSVEKGHLKTVSQGGVFINTFSNFRLHYSILGINGDTVVTQTACTATVKMSFSSLFIVCPKKEHSVPAGRNWSNLYYPNTWV